MNAPAAAVDASAAAARIAQPPSRAINAPIRANRPTTPRPEVLLRPQPDPQAPLPLATAGVQRWVWEGRYGTMLIEVVGDDVFVNGDRVEPHAAPQVPR